MRDELEVGGHARGLLRVREQRPCRQRDQVARRLESPDDHDLEVRLDLLARQPLAVDLGVEHARQQGVVGGVAEPLEDRRHGLVDLLAGAVRDALLLLVALEVRGPERELVEPAPQRLLVDRVAQARGALQHINRERFGEVAGELDLTAVHEAVDQFVRDRCDHLGRVMADRLVAEPGLDDRSDPLVIRPFRAEQVLPERPVERRRLCLGSEDIGHLDHLAHVVPAGDEPEPDRLDPRDRLVGAQARVYRVRVALEVLDRHRGANRRGLRHDVLLKAISSYVAAASAAWPTSSLASSSCSVRYARSSSVIRVSASAQSPPIAPNVPSSGRRVSMSGMNAICRPTIATWSAPARCAAVASEATSPPSPLSLTVSGIETASRTASVASVTASGESARATDPGRLSPACGADRLSSSHRNPAASTSRANPGSASGSAGITLATA